METNQQIMQLQQWLDEATSIVFFGGAGISTESGIPDFRSVDGLYNQSYKYPPETILSHTFYEQKSDEFFRFYRDKMIYMDAQPSAAHIFLSKLEECGKLSAIVTQNIDGLHQAAGNKKVYELHGSVLRNYCEHCHTFYPVEYIKESIGTPHCTCGGRIKPDVVLYEEGLDQNTINKAILAITTCDMLIIGGTSLNVYPAASFINYYQGHHMVLINKTNTPQDNKADLVIHDALGSVFSALTI